MNAGVASNCVFRGGKANYSGCVSMWGTAKLLDSLIENGENTDTNPSNAARGGGLKIAGNAEARRCTINGCKAYMGAGATVEGSALFVDCTVTGSTVTGGHGQSGGAGIHIRGSAVVSNCVVRACTNLVGTVNSGYGGGGVHIQGGLLVNTLVTGNRGNVGGGICQNGGKIVNCTVAKNTTTTSASGVSQKSGQIVNTIIAGSEMNDATALVTTGGTIAYSCAIGLATTFGNIDVDPMGYFRDPQSGDYSMLSSFPGIDAGDTSVVFAEGATDVSGATPRVADGNGDGVAAIDMGAYEYDYASMPINVSLAYSVVAYEAFSPTTVRLTPALEGPYGEVTSVLWDFGDGRSESAQAVDVTDHDYAAAGTYTVTLTAETTLGGPLDKSITFTLAPLVVYVSNDGSDEAPYDTAARATPSFADAIGALGTPLSGAAYVIVADGNYVAPATRVNITKDIEIRGNDADPSRIVIDGQRTSGGNGRAFFFVNSPLALVHGVTFVRGDTTGSQTSGGPANYSQAALEIAAGAVSNCVIDNISCSYAGGVSVWGTGRLIDCLISNCTNRDGNGDYAAKGGGVKMYQNAYVAGCTITNCVAIRGAGLHMFGGTAENCVLFANSTKDGTSRGGGLCMEGGTARNILAYGNRCHREGGGVYVGGGVLECATVADNTAQSGKGRDLYMTAGTVRNCIVADALTAYDSADAPLVTTGGAATHTCSPSLTAGADGNVADAPVFKNGTKGNYTVRIPSPTINAGVNADWMADALDLAGNHRIASKIVDMGCYEQVSTPTMLLLR